MTSITLKFQTSKVCVGCACHQVIFVLLVTYLYLLSYLCVGYIKIFYACIVILLHKEKCACRKPTILFVRLILFLSGNDNQSSLKKNDNQSLSIQISNQDGIPNLIPIQIGTTIPSINTRTQWVKIGIIQVQSLTNS